MPAALTPISAQRRKAGLVVAEKMAIKGAKQPRRKNEWRRQGKEMSRNGRAKGAREEQRVATQAVGTLEGRGESDPSQMAGDDHYRVIASKSAHCRQIRRQQKSMQ